MLRSSLVSTIPYYLLQRHNFGEHERGKSASCVRDGLIPVKFETFRKTLGKFGVKFLGIQRLILLYQQLL